MLKISGIHINYETNPTGISGNPQFGWEIESDMRCVKQTSYRLLIAKDENFANPVYDSKVVESEESAHVQAKDAPAESVSGAPKWMESLTRYFVRAEITAEGSAAGGEKITQSAVSGPAWFITALINGEGWKAPFVSAETDDSYKECSKGTYVRGRVTVKKPLKEAYAVTTALGLYNFFLNGKKVGEDEMTPGWTSYQRHLLYQTYEVTNYLKEGVNTAGAMLAAGWYKGVMGLTKARNNYDDRTGLAMELLLRYEDGSEEWVCTDTDWTGADSPIIFSEIYDGEIYDSSLEIPGWADAPVPEETAGPDAEEKDVFGRWRKTVEVPFDNSVLRAQSGARVKMMDALCCQKIIRTPKGETVLDFGQNMAGRIHVTAFGRPGDVIELHCFEVLDSEGNVYLDNLRKAKATMKYIFSKEETVTWHPRFTYMGFRYALVVSWPGTASGELSSEISPENFTAYTLHSNMERTGEITCSNPLLNQLHHNFLWGMKGNFLDVPTDCPQRDERLGWTGDAQIFCRTASYLANTYTFFKKWLRDVEVDQTPEGGVPHVVPNIEEGRTDGNWLLRQGPHSAAAWADVAVIAPWTLYLMFGDKEILKQQYGSMKGWIGFMREHSEDYIWNYRLQFGDWVALDAEEGSYFGATPNDLTCTAYFAYSTGLFAKIARILKKPEAAEYEALYEKIVQKFQQTFFDKEGNLTAQTQTAHIVALYFKLTPKAYVARTVEGLKRLLEKENGHLVTGFVGTPYFCHALSQNGCVKEAYDLLLKEDFPSWLYQVKMGATTIWEHWDGLKPDGTMWSADMNSFNHYAYGAIGEWMYRVMAGLEADEKAGGFKHAVLYPRPGGGLAFVEGTYHSVYGQEYVRWDRDGKKVTLKVKIPANTTAEIRLDNADTVLEADGLAFTEAAEYLTAQAGSGEYRITYQTK
ncbi:MAG: glycoside hydrolase family 78 protein [Lachnospiraceae bacterium]|nr:glycoside hydrolase family 78 protein [Lachnospiraceae bacterium]